MGYILIDHGELDLGGTYPQGMGTIGIDAGTTIQFYADTGQALEFGNVELDLWDQLQAPWPPLDSTNVTYNFKLAAHTPEERAGLLANAPAFGGHTLVLPGRDLPEIVLLCDGSPETCPTDPRQVAAGWTHTCQGVLGQYQGELHWIACTSVATSDEATQDAVAAARDSAPESVMLGADPDDMVSSGRVFLEHYPDDFGEWFNTHTEEERAQLLGDDTIAEWHRGRTPPNP